MIHRAANLLASVMARPLPPRSAAEETSLEELKTTFRNLPVYDTTNLTPSESIWFSCVNRLRELVLTADPREFLRWRPILEMMFTSYAPYLSTELKGLKGRPDWKGRWEPAIRETTVGRPLPYIYHPSTSGTALHHAFHIASFEDRTRDSVEQMDFVLEFGAGYGSMCRVMFNLGFRGTYVCFDLAPCSALQRYYLKTVGLPVVGPSELKKDGSPAIVCISTYDDLKRLLTNVSDETRSMFIATWSLGESPIAQRDRILPLLSRFRSFLFAYYHRFGEVDNVEFFDTWQATQRNVEWSGSPIEHMPGNTYLMGRRSRRADTSA